MRHSWSNIVIFVLMMVLAISGYYGMVNNREPAAWLLWVHGIAAYGLVVTLYWKVSIVLFAVRRKKKWTGRRIGFAVTGVLLLVTLVMGLLWTFVGPIYVGGFSLVSLHIYVAVPVMILMVWHSWHMRFVLRLPETFGRRLWLGGVAAAVLGAIGWRTAEAGMDAYALPGAKRRFTGSYERGSFSQSFPVVSWINDRIPYVAREEWRLEVTGAVGRPLVLNYEEMRSRPLIRQTAVLDCTGGWYAEQIWGGVRLGELLDAAGVEPSAKSVTVVSVTGYRRRFALDVAREYLLALDVAGRPLSDGHGFPLRLVAHNRRGVEWVKWVSRIEVNETSHLWQSPLPLS